MLRTLLRAKQHDLEEITGFLVLMVGCGESTLADCDSLDASAAVTVQKAVPLNFLGKADLSMRLWLLGLEMA